MRAEHIKHHAANIGCHVLACLDDNKHPPRWLRRVSKVGRVVHIAVLVFSVTALREPMLLLVFGAAVASLFVGEVPRHGEPAPELEIEAEE
jgi:hypothetical protein